MPVRLCALAVVLLAAPAVSAQMLPSGTWTGTLTDAGRGRHEVSAEIERCATGFRVLLDVDGRVAETETAAWERGRLRFALPRLRMPGTILPRMLSCDLRQQPSGALAGACSAGRARYALTLTPPSDGAIGCD